MSNYIFVDIFTFRLKILSVARISNVEPQLISFDSQLAHIGADLYHESDFQLMLKTK